MCYGVKSDIKKSNLYEIKIPPADDASNGRRQRKLFASIQKQRSIAAFLQRFVRMLLRRKRSENRFKPRVASQRIPKRI